jgi:hypothetical protein
VLGIREFFPVVKEELKLHIAYRFVSKDVQVNPGMKNLLSYRGYRDVKRLKSSGMMVSVDS